MLHFNCKFLKFTYVKNAIAGNCQVQPLAIWLRSNLPESKIINLAPYHLLENQQQIDHWLAESETADYIMAIPVHDGYGGFTNLGSKRFRSIFGTRLKFYPNLHNDAFFPFFDYAKTEDGKQITHAMHPGNPHGDYHDFMSMAICTSRLPWGRLMRLRLKLAMRQKSFIVANARQSLRELNLRLIDMNSSLAGQQISINSFFGFTFNHPRSLLLNQLYLSIWLKVFGGRKDEFIPIKFEPFQHGTNLPIPTFVQKALVSAFPELENSPLPRELCNYDLYEELLKRSMKYYLSNPWIIEQNLNHKKFKYAKKYLRYIA